MTRIEGQTMPDADIVEESKRILNAAEEQGIMLRLFGGLAIRFHCPSASHRQLTRNYADIDFMGLRKQGKEIRKLFQSLGYAPRERFNAMQGDRRLIFQDVQTQRRIDIFLDIFEMCQRFDFRNRLSLDKTTIPLADLLATKLQVVEMTEREYKDMIALLHDHEIGDTDADEVINGKYLAQLCADDWGIYKTFTINIANVLNALTNYNLEAKDKDVIQKRLQNLLNVIEAAPKSVKWKMRASVGEKMRWYELPEADKKIVEAKSGISRGRTVE